MELFLDNIGVVKESRIKLDGLTVITGKNSSGKTTVGKVMYSLVSAGSDVEKAFKKSKRDYICSQLDEIADSLRLQRTRQLFFVKEEVRGNEVNEVLTTLVTHGFRQYDDERLFDFIIRTKNLISRLTLEHFKEYLNNFYSERNESFIEALAEEFPKSKENILDICKTTIELVRNENAYYNFLKDRTSAFLNHEFNNQIKPVKQKNVVSKIELLSQGKYIVNAKIKTEKNIFFTEESSFVYPLSRCTFIDNPYVVDKLGEYDNSFHFFYKFTDANNSNSIISSEDIKDHDEILAELLINSEKKNYFDDLELQNKYRDVFDKINKIVPGEFSKTSDGYFYVDNGMPLSVKNLATGSKMFFIIKKLLLNGLVDGSTMLVLDEPESHLHPEWINKFAEILVCLVENVKVNVLLTTHSPNLMLALNVYAKKRMIDNKSHFYLAETEEDGFSRIRCIDESIGEGYSHLSIPLVEMNLELESVSEE